jgi:hypothetical protein
MRPVPRWRVNSFLKVTTDEGIVGWSEYMEGYGAQGLTGAGLAGSDHQGGIFPVRQRVSARTRARGQSRC